MPVFIKNARECGEVFAYDDAWDKTTVQKQKTLKGFKGHTFDETVFDDPIMEELMEGDEADIFTTDLVAAVLMCSNKSNYSWDVEITKVKDKIIIDKRTEDDAGETKINTMNKDDKINILNFATVCETANEHQPWDNDSMNGIKSLMREAQEINNNWLQACQNPNSKHSFDNDDPFIEDPHQVATRIGYVYKIWKIQEADKANGKKEMKICIRCTVHTKVSGAGPPRFMNVYAVNEHNLNRTNWRQDIATKKISVLNKELEDNQFKISRWIVQSLLADVDQIKLAFVTRERMEDNKKHVVLATERLNTKQWAQQINMSMDKLWSIIRHIVQNVVSNKSEGEEEDHESPMTEYVLLKEQQRMSMKLYKKGEEEEGEA